MTNLEKFEDEIKLIVYCGEKFAVRKCDGEVEECRGMICSDCKFYGENTDCYRQRAKWIREEYEKPTPKVDWSKVPIDTPILVRSYETVEWEGRYFAGYIGGKVCAFGYGTTSENFKLVDCWEYAKLADKESD